MYQIDQDITIMREELAVLCRELSATTDPEWRTQLQHELNTCTEAYINHLEHKIERLTIRCGSLRTLLEECARGYHFFKDGSRGALMQDELPDPISLPQTQPTSSDQDITAPKTG